MRKISYRLIFVVFLIPLCYANSEYDQADKDLNNIYQKLQKVFSEEQKKKLQDSQRLWIKYTDENCKFRAENYIDSIKACKTRESIKRSEELIQLSEPSGNYIGDCAKERQIGNRASVPCFIETTKNLEIEITNLLNKTVELAKKLYVEQTSNNSEYGTSYLNQIINYQNDGYLAWKSYRDNECSYLTYLDGMTGDIPFVIESCKLDMTKEYLNKTRETASRFNSNFK